MRVLHVVSVGPDGLAPEFMRQQISCLTEAGFEGDIFAFAGATYARAPHRLPADLRALRREIRRFRPDIVHAHWGSLLALMSAAGTLAGPPLVITFRGSDINPVPSERAVRSFVRIACSQAATRRAAAVICVSDELRRRLWVAGHRASVIVDGVDLGRFVPQDRRDARRLLGWREDEHVVLFNVGNRPLVKRLDLAEAAVAEARNALGTAVRLERLSGHLPHAHMPALINAADCVLMTSDFEGSPNIVREALACDVPVVSVDVGDVQRWLGGVGTRVVARDAVQLGAAIAGLLRSGERPGLGPSKEMFSDVASRDAVINVYRNILPAPSSTAATVTMS